MPIADEPWGLEGLTPEDAALISRATLDKHSKEVHQTFIQFGSVVSVAQDPGSVPYATVHIDGDPSGVTAQMASLAGIPLYQGMRVAVMFDRPHGAYVIGSASSSGVVPVARGGMWSSEA